MNKKERKYGNVARSKQLMITGFTNSSCSLACPNCSMDGWMKGDPNYQWSLQDIDKFIYYTKKSNYKFPSFIMAGGEPLLWDNVVEGTKMISNSGIAKRVALESNGVGRGGVASTLDLMGTILENIDNIRISKYLGNKKHISAIRNAFPSFTKPKGKIQFVDKVVHYMMPKGRCVDTLPAQCTCPWYKIKGDEIQICSAISCIIYRFNWNKKDYSKYFEKLKVGYLERLKTINKLTQKYCEYCFGNYKIRRYLKPKRH